MIRKEINKMKYINLLYRLIRKNWFFYIINNIVRFFFGVIESIISKFQMNVFRVKGVVI